MKFILAASALALSASSVTAQTTVPAPPSPPATAVTPPVTKPVRRSVTMRKRLTPTVARVAAANRAATLEPQAQDFVNAVQIFPFSDGAIYQVYTAPGAVTDIALQWLPAIPCDGSLAIRPAALARTSERTFW